VAHLVVTKHPIGAALWAGLIGGQIATLWGILVARDRPAFVGLAHH